MTSLALITTKISSLDAHIQLCENHKDTEGVEMAYCRLGPCLCAGQCRGAEPRLTAGCPARIGVRADLGVEEGEQGGGEYPLAAHNASFDCKCWDAELARIQRTRRLEFVCSLLLSRRPFPPGIS